MHPDAILNPVLAAQLPRKEYNELPLLPVAVLEGPVGSGKTDTLKRLEERWREGATVLRIGMREVANSVEPYRVAVALAEALLRSSTPVSFRRLSLGLAALETQIGNLEQAERDLDRHLSRRDLAVPAVTVIVNRARDELPALPFPAPGAGLVLAGVPPLVWAIRKRHRSYHWFAAATGARTPIRGLVTLNRWYAASDTTQVNALLLRAFLEDLRRSFTRWLDQARFKSNVLLLLDDVESLAGRRFLSALLTARTHNPTEGDPLLVIATSGVRTDTLLAPHAVVRGECPLADGLVHVIPLLDPTRAEPADHADRLRSSIAGGHRWGAGQLHEAADANHEIHVGALLTDELADTACKWFLADLTPEQQNDLLAAAAVHPRDPGIAPVNAALTDPTRPELVRYTEAAHRQAAVEQFVWGKLWAPPGTRDLQPFFRRVLLHRLSRKPDAHHESWVSIFTRLRDAHTRNDHRADSPAHARDDHQVESPWYLHYQLASDGHAIATARALGKRLDDPRSQGGWLKDLDIITAAPRRATASDPDTYTNRFTALVEDHAENLSPREHLIATIVGAIWLSRNLLGAPDLFEYLEIAAALDALAVGRPPAQRKYLHTRAEIYRRHHQGKTFFEPENAPDHPEEPR